MATVRVNLQEAVRQLQPSLMYELRCEECKLAQPFTKQSKVLHERDLHRFEHSKHNVEVFVMLESGPVKLVAIAEIGKNVLDFRQSQAGGRK